MKTGGHIARLLLRLLLRKEHFTRSFISVWFEL